MDYFSLFQNSDYHREHAKEYAEVVLNLLSLSEHPNIYRPYMELMKTYPGKPQAIFNFCWCLTSDKIYQDDVELLMAFYQSFAIQILNELQVKFPSLVEYFTSHVADLPDIRLILHQCDPSVAVKHLDSMLKIIKELDRIFADRKEINRRGWKLPPSCPNPSPSEGLGQEARKYLPQYLSYLDHGMNEAAVIQHIGERLWKAEVEKIPRRTLPTMTTFYHYATVTPPIGWEDHFAKQAHSLAKVEERITRFAKKRWCPDKQNIFRAYELVTLPRVRVVVMGQDPYHDSFIDKEGKEQLYSTGLSFSLNADVPIMIGGNKTYKKSIDVIIEELRNNYPNVKLPQPINGSLEKWTEQGVMLLNASLTTEVGEKNDHHKDVWTDFIQETLNQIITANPKVIFLLWGKKAEYYDHHFLPRNITRFVAAHPSPLNTTGGFSGCQHFKLVNDKLWEFGLPPINWDLV